MQKTSKKSVPVKEKLACGAGEVANRFGENGVNDPVMNIYTLILGASPATIGLILSIQKIWDAISDPVMGYVSDNWKGKKGRRKPFILIGSILMTLTYPLLWYASPNWTEWSKAIYFIAISIIFFTSYTIFSVPFRALTAEITPDYQERTIVDDPKKLGNEKIQFPVVLKFTSTTVLHKTELGAVELNINNVEELIKKYFKMKRAVGSKELKKGFFFIEEMLPKPIAELFLSIRKDKTFGDILVLGMGGSLTEIYSDTKTFILPVSKNYMLKEVRKMNFFNLINGFRNRSKVNLDMMTHEIFKIIKFHQEEANRCHSIEINPAFVYEDAMIATDCVLSTG